jgi:serine protease AprX
VPSGSSGTPGFDSGVTGRGVTVAVLDSGIMDHPDLRDSLLGAVDFVDDARDAPGASDLFGHGTHVAGIIAGHGAGAGGTFSGIAPGTPLVSVRVLDGQGQGTSSGVIRGIEWATAHRDAYGIRVLTLSLGHPIHEAAGKDPLVRAVEAACAAGLVVVTSAGNFGQNGSFTITSPGNAPNAVTVGSSSDGDSAATNGGVGSATDGDTVAMNGAHAAIGSSTDGDEARAASASVSSFSSHGPTYIDHFLKPDLVAPGNAIVSLRAAGSSLDREFPDRRVAVDVAEEPAYFSMSGTSVAAPIVAATAALMLASEPDLEPATIKARLMLSANPGLDADLLARGAGLLDLPGALAQRVLAQNAASPRVIQAGSCCELSIEQPTEPWTLPMGWDGVRLQGDAGLWGDAVLWGDANLWGDAALWNYPVSWQDGIPVPD